ncbi:ABC transporter substrate-binding protein [Gorillibacterium sp. sgz5001074]|uniref:ABC transporter substrate-binding protein n=1 Tax=Gorillibacterium sp. sgz5001074 TaxID=3446695 RepID=UPI003F671A8A
MKRKITALVSCVTLTAGLTACGGGSDSASPSPAASAAPGATQQATSKPSGEKTKLTYWTGDRHDADYIKEVVNKFNTTNKDNIEVELVVKTEDFNQAIDLAFATADTPDIIRVKENTIQTFYKKDYLAPIDSYLTPDMKAKFPAMDELNSFNGKMYSLPNYGSTLRLVYNMELFEKAGIKTPPTTLKEMVEDAKKITEVGKANGSYGFALNFKSPASAFGRSARVIAEVSGYGGFGYDFKTARFDFTGFKPIIEAFKQMKDDGSTLPGMDALDIDPLRAQFAEGKIGMYISFSSEPGVYKNQFPAKIKWAAAPVPSIDGQIKGASSVAGGQWLAISSKSKKKDQAWKFMQFMYQEEVLQTYHEKGFGISMVPSVNTKAKKPDINGIDGFLPNKYDGVWPVMPTVTVKGIKSDDAFFKYMIAGGDINAVITDLNKRYNEALDAAIAAGEVKAAPKADFDPAKLAGQLVK